MQIASVLAILLIISGFDLHASPALNSLSDWLALDREKRPPLTSAEFSKLPLVAEDAKQAVAMLWKDHAAMIKETRAAEFDGKKLKIGDNEMPYLAKTFGEKPATGRSLYISMHGGGGAPARVNDQQWQNQIKLYQPEEGIYLAPRAPGNTWNLWHQGHVDGLFDRLIENLIVFEDVNPDKVYLMGYSAGGDGVYQLAPRMADRFAAAAMMAGHPNESVPLGLRNLPFTLHVGGNDAAYKRNEIVPQWDKRLNELQQADPGGYVHEAKVHEGKPHWMGLQDKVAVPWMAKFTRERFPDRVVWKQDDVTHQRFYWLGIPEDAVKGRQLAIVKRDGQVFTVEKVEDVSKLTILVNDAMVNMDETIVIKMGDKQLFEGKVKRSLAAIHTTMLARGDPRLVFYGGVTVTLEEEK
ncbi:MAG: poly(3-hydroxybutyrate) depolymerase [Verrucomicrobiales bacterium]|jgi:poly(3-hydroxybutyrate) depolymerase